MPEHFNEININTSEVQIAFARMEAKLDVALAQHGAKLEQHGAAIETLREEHKDNVIKHDVDVSKLDVRIRTIENTPTVSPKALGAVVVGGAGVLGALFPFLDRLYS
jgi:hypothetical protein